MVSTTYTIHMTSVTNLTAVHWLVISSCVLHHCPVWLFGGINCQKACIEKQPHVLSLEVVVLDGQPVVMQDLSPSLLGHFVFVVRSGNCQTRPRKVSIVLW